MTDITSDNILDFWFSDRVKPLHFIKNSALDKEVSDRFYQTYKKASNSILNDWQRSAESSLALIIILDQFPRNMFRNTQKAFRTDSDALKISKDAIDNGFNANLNQEQCTFLYMPFMHSEDLSEQEFSVKLYSQLGIENNLSFAIAHRDIIRRFGRFPHRNDIMERKSTLEEIEFLKNPGSGF